MSFRLVVAFVISLVVSAAVGIFLIPALRRMKAGQSIREDGPVWHNKKQGTPTMGGFIFMGGIVVACLTLGIYVMVQGDFGHVFILLFALVNAAIGVIDDYAKLKKKQNLGLRVRQKLLLQIIVTAIFLIVIRYSRYFSTELYIPFINVSLHIPPPVYFIFSLIVIVGTVNAVNITDGVDGLATGVTIPVAVCFALIARLWGSESVGVFAAALAGGLIAFLIFNFHPAKVFMGDTGSLFLGGAICAMAFILDMPLVLILLGIVYMVETLSDIIQILYFKITHGKRIFKMAPFHHHLEMCGWSEYKLFYVFSGVSAAFAVLSYLGVFSRYG